MNTYLLHSIHSCSSAAYHMYTCINTDKQRDQICPCNYTILLTLYMYISDDTILCTFYTLCSPSCKTFQVLEPMIILHSYLLPISLGGTYDHFIFISPVHQFWWNLYSFYIHISISLSGDTSPSLQLSQLSSLHCCGPGSHGDRYSAPVLSGLPPVLDSLRCDVPSLHSRSSQPHL